MKISSGSVMQTRNTGKKIAAHLKPGDIICLFGQLGSGKTVLVKGIAEGLKIKNRPIISPTFVLLRQYLTGRLPLNHFDLYRLKKTKEMLFLGYEEYLYDEAVTVIEWADRLGCLLPAEYLKIELSIDSASSRSLKFSAFGSRYKELLERANEDIRH